MLVLRPEQLAALALDARERFILSVLPTLPEVFPDDPAVLDRAAMREVIASGIDRAAAYGIHDDPQVALFVYLLHELGPSFDELPWIAPVLRHPQLGPAEKLDLIYTRLEQRG